MRKKTFQLNLAFLFLLTLVACASESKGDEGLEHYIQQRAIPLERAADLDAIIRQTQDRKLVLLGEASHGTHEYYIWRDSISRRLIAENGFNFIAVEGDFASIYELNRYVKNMPGAASSAKEVLLKLDRWPLWMWGNEEVVELAEWLRLYNDSREPEQKVGIYGMDVYDEWRSKTALLEFLSDNHTDLYRQVSELYECFRPFKNDSWGYAQAVAGGNPDCTDETQKVVALMEGSREEFRDLSELEYFYALQNAYVKLNAERFYRKSLIRRDASSWNSRVHHMHETVNRLLELYGEHSRGIVWAHNTHIGDARFTEMQGAGNQNIGELSRVHWGPENVFAIGFTTYKGRVLAGGSWEGRMQSMRIAPARRGSVERIFYNTGIPSFYMIFDDQDRTRQDFVEPMGHRAIGVVFDPGNEPRQYVNTVLPLRYDAFIFFETTKALNPLRN